MAHKSCVANHSSRWSVHHSKQFNVSHSHVYCGTTGVRMSIVTFSVAQKKNGSVARYTRMSHPVAIADRWPHFPFGLTNGTLDGTQRVEAAHGPMLTAFTFTGISFFFS